MSISGLTIIAESINDSVPGTKALFDAGDMAGVVELARLQAEKGAAYIDVNVGTRGASFMAEVIRQIQRHVTLPLSIDTPDVEMAAAGLEVYDAQLAGGRLPILNSISAARLEMFDLYRKTPFMPILLATEGKSEADQFSINLTAEQTFTTAKFMVQTARERMAGVANDRLILDLGIMPVGSDSVGNFRRLISALEMVKNDADLAGINASVGLSNFTVQLPAKRADGSPVRGPLESAFLTLAMPLGLNMAIASVKRSYSLLPDDHAAMQCVRDILELDGMDIILRVMSFIS